MGFFRRHKANRHTLTEAKGMVMAYRHSIINHVVNNAADEDIDQALEAWASWRELQARLENDNHGREDGGPE